MIEIEEIKAEMVELEAALPYLRTIADKEQIKAKRAKVRADYFLDECGTVTKRLVVLGGRLAKLQKDHGGQNNH